MVGTRGDRHAGNGNGARDPNVHSSYPDFIRDAMSLFIITGIYVILISMWFFFQLNDQ